MINEELNNDVFGGDDVVEVSDELFKWDKPGKEIAGLLVRHKTQTMDNGPAEFYTVITKQGEQTFIATSALHEKLSKFKLGEFLVKVVFEEERPSKKGGRQPFKVFSVKATPSTEAKLAAMGIVSFGESETTEE